MDPRQTDRTIFDILNQNREWGEEVERCLSDYRLIYGLPLLENHELIPPSFFNYCLAGKYFVVVALYNSRREFFIQRDFFKMNDRWELVGGWLREDETFDQALDRIVAREAGNTLVEAVPISLVKNYYSVSAETNGKSTYHLGVAFLGRIRHDMAASQNGAFSSDAEGLLNVHDVKIYKLGKKFLEQRVIEPPLHEVDSLNNRKVARWLHNHVIKPLCYFGSSRILQNIIYRNVLAVGDDVSRMIIDVACGDDTNVLKLSQKAKLVVANDIARQSMAHLIKHRCRENNIIFTNQNLLELEFTVHFDVVICKNVLHHMRNAQEIDALFGTLKKLGKRLLIMDVENPRCSMLARWWNNYYRLFLYDRGGFFITFEQFHEIVNLYYAGVKKIFFQRIQTVKGKYMLAVIDQQENF